MWFCEVADFSKHIPGAEKIQLRVRDGERKIAGRKGLISVKSKSRTCPEHSRRVEIFKINWMESYRENFCGDNEALEQVRFRDENYYVALAVPGRLVGLSALKTNAAAAPPSSSATM